MLLYVYSNMLCDKLHDRSTVAFKSPCTSVCMMSLSEAYVGAYCYDPNNCGSLWSLNYSHK